MPNIRNYISSQHNRETNPKEIEMNKIKLSAIVLGFAAAGAFAQAPAAAPAAAPRRTGCCPG